MLEWVNELFSGSAVFNLLFFPPTEAIAAPTFFPLHRHPSMSAYYTQRTFTKKRELLPTAHTNDRVKRKVTVHWTTTMGTDIIPSSRVFDLWHDTKAIVLDSVGGSKQHTCPHDALFQDRAKARSTFVYCFECCFSCRVAENSSLFGCHVSWTRILAQVCCHGAKRHPRQTAWYGIDAHSIQFICIAEQFVVCGTQ